MNYTLEELILAQQLYNIDTELNKDKYKDFGTYNMLSIVTASDQIEQLLSFVSIVRENKNKQ